MFAVVKKYNQGELFGRVLANYNCRYEAMKFIDSSERCSDLVIVITKRKKGDSIRNYKPQNYLREWMHPEQNPDPRQAVLLFSYS